jgi:hypothetical protein
VSGRDAGLVYACVTHVPLWLEPPPWLVTIRLGETQGEGGLDLRDLAPDWLPHHPVLGGTAGSFALRRYVLERRPDATRVGICQYRKFVSPRRIRRARDPRYRVMDVVPKPMLDGHRFAAALWPGDAEFLVSAPRRFTRVFWHRRGYLHEYARDHCVDDFLHFTAAAVEQGVLDRSDVEAFFAEDVIIPGGAELGVYPAAFWLATVEQIERVVRACVGRNAPVRDGAQARAWSFCAERLGSWLVLRRFRSEVAGRPEGGAIEWLDRQRWRARFTGQLNLVTQDDAHRGYSAGA